MTIKRFTKLLACFLIALFICFTVVACVDNEEGEDEEPQVTGIKNVILFIGDGMGPNQVRYGELKNGSPLSFQKFEHQTVVDTNSLNSEGKLVLTDSAAAATALATGVLTRNGRVGYGADNVNEPLKTIMDWALEKGKRTGIISTENLLGATPMSFSGHAESRSDSEDLLKTAAKSGVNFFAGDKTIDCAYHAANGYSVAVTLEQLSRLMDKDKIVCDLSIHATKPDNNPDYVLLNEIVVAALNYLSQDEDGFVLMAEGAHIDKRSHANDIVGMVEQLLAFDKAVEAAVNWAKNRNDTVILVTADHETGGLQLKDGITSENMNESDYYEWTTGGHTDANVGLYVTGLDELDFTRYSYFGETKVKNTDIFNICKDLVIYGKLMYGEIE